MSRLLARVEVDKVAELIAQEGNVARTFDHLSAFLNPAEGMEG